MSEFRVRLRAVRLKSGGAEVRVIRNERAEEGEEDWRGAIIRNARTTAEQATEEAPLVGYLMIGLYGDGCTSASFRYDPEKCPVPRALLPAWVSEVVRRDVIMDGEARNVFDEMFQWVE